MGTNQIKSIGRTKKLGPTINEHRNEKTYLKNWNLGALWKKKYKLSLVGCWKETNKEGFWQKGKMDGILTEGFLATNERSVSGRVKVWVSKWVAADEGIVSGRVRVSVFEGGECLSVWVWEWVIWVSEWVFESVRVTSEIFDSVFEWFWSFKIWVFVTRVYNQVL